MFGRRSRTRRPKRLTRGSRRQLYGFLDWHHSKRKRTYPASVDYHYGIRER